MKGKKDYRNSRGGLLDMKYTYFIIFYMMILVPVIFPMGITASGDWSVSVDESDLLGGAGSDVESTYTSNANQTNISIIGTQDGDWQVNISKVDQTWHSDFTIYARRTSGTGITGGSTYQEITDSDRYFFNGTGDYFIIGIQYQLEGISLQIPAATYSIIVYYTLIDL
jgi:hypothetical protein